MMLLKLGSAVTLSLLISGETPSQWVEQNFTREYQEKECRGELADKQKIWLYEARARRVVPPFSPEWCRQLGIVPFTDMYKESGS